MSYDYSPLLRSNRLNTRQAGLTFVFFVLALIFLGATVLPHNSNIVIIDVCSFLALMVGGLYMLLETYRYQHAIDAFAVRNNLIAVPSDLLLGLLPPCLQTIGHSQIARNGYIFEIGPDQPAIVFEYKYTVGEGRNQTTYHFTIASLRKTDEQFPHLFLDAHHNHVPHDYQNSQRLSLEGDFNQFFTLYAPNGLATEALTLFTPDVMQTLITAGRPYDLEIWNDSVWTASRHRLYTREQLPLLLQFLGALNHELSQEAVDWSPVAATATPVGNLKAYRFGSPVHLALTIVVIIFYIGLIVAGQK